MTAQSDLAARKKVIIDRLMSLEEQELGDRAGALRRLPEGFPVG